MKASVEMLLLFKVFASGLRKFRCASRRWIEPEGSFLLKTRSEKKSKMRRSWVVALEDRGLEALKRMVNVCRSYFQKIESRSLINFSSYFVITINKLEC